MSDPITRLNSALEGRYRIESELGEGGMATVYLGDDVRHERKVALKVLKPEFAAVVGAERFLAEIKTTANLQHPHILPLFDSGEADGFLFYVMPFIEGETLAGKLDQEKQLGVDEAVRIARDVADALDYAHRNDIIHRDIKPANILLHDGRPMVADFGIALAVSAAGGGRLTETGLSLGTPHYMSPEQASADRDLSARSDVYSLGCVLYEMLAGQPPHTGPSAQSILVRILTEDPRPITELRRTVPPNVAAAVTRSIEKLPADRFDTAKQFMEALEDGAFEYQPLVRTKATSAATQAATPAAAAAQRLGVPLWATAFTGLVMLAVGLVVSNVTRAEPPLQPSVRVTVVADSSHRLVAPCCGRSVAVSPDGSRIVYQGRDADYDQVRLYQRPLNQDAALPIPGTEGGRHPFFSPTGEWLGFFSSGSLLKIRFDGGTPLTVVSGVGRNAGAAWSRDDMIVYAAADGPGLFRVSADAGTPEVLTTVDSAAGEWTHRWPHVMPDGRAVVFGIGMNAGDPPAYEALASTSIDGGGHQVIGTGADPRYVAAGYLTFSDGAGSIMAQPFDARRMELTGSRFRIVEGAIWRGGRAMTEYDISRNGTVVHRRPATSGEAGARELVLVALDGSEETVATLGRIRHPRFSPDGRFIAYESQSNASQENDDIWVWDLERSIPIRVTFENDNSHPVWDRAGDRLYFETATTISARSADGSGETEVILPAEGAQEPLHLSPDGQWLLWDRNTEGRQRDVWMAPLDGSAEPRLFLDSPFQEYGPAVSPDGRWIAYVSNESGQAEIYVEPFPDRGSKFKLTTGGAWAPVWAPNGTRLYYRRINPPAIDLVAVDVVDGDRFAVGEHQTLFPTAGYAAAFPTLYDIHPDGTHFVFVRPLDGTGAGVQASAQASNVVITNALNPGLEGNR